MNAAVLLGVAQALCLLILVVTLLHIALSRGMSDAITLVLLSPALVLFWVNDADTPFRKEMLGYLVFVPLFLGRSGAVSRGRLVSSTVIFTIAVAVHEANAIFIVPFGLVLWALLAWQQAIVWTVANGLIALGFSAFSWANLQVSSIENMCARAVEAGASPAVCEGTMAWLVSDFARVVGDGRVLVSAFGGTANYALAAVLFALLFGCFGFAVRHLLRDRQTLLCVTAGVAAMLPLFVLGADWGRWVSIQMFVALFIVLAMAEKRGLSVRSGQMAVVPYSGILAFNLFVGVFHMVPVPRPGFVQTVITAVGNFLS